MRAALLVYLQAHPHSSFFGNHASIAGAEPESQLTLIAETFLRPVTCRMAELICSLWRTPETLWLCAAEVRLLPSVSFDLAQYRHEIPKNVAYRSSRVFFGQETLFDLVDNRASE
jgi:hypothetical protein